MVKVSPLMAVPVLIFGAFAGLAFFGLQREDPEGLPSVLVGRSAPEVTSAPLLDHPEFQTSDLMGEGVKLVNFWASWCAPCRAEHPNLMELAKEFPIYGINQDYGQQEAQGFLDELGNPYSGLLYDVKKRQSIDWGVYGLPETFVIDGKGKILLRIAGPLTQRVIENSLRPVLDPNS
ncbi:DsbE family thiol:disulfide interchange protein [Epibacterium sp. SM1979]|uniref:DsbE family thiol:disulfide interchange protein n=1 Tax=Tritonibacter litoralis TaxID=2662264 RepID=A0A843YBN4_9RHOB|nr:DsbE family thiol:disulfide interchange protein [Tritonibacter litoralis]MQQ06874.1 DsbE family thiol:disulfide interchange protein [Tritonibacter litoralis]